jgi:transcriptional regulator with XRE-family HTH domain
MESGAQWNRLREIRERMGLTLAEVANAADERLTFQQLSALERAVRPRHETIVRVIVALNLVTPRSERGLQPVTIADVLQPLQDEIDQRVRGAKRSSAKRSQATRA